MTSGHVLICLAAFLAGSIPFGYLVARAKGKDIRREGSGNIGATNVGRVLGTRFAILVFAMDFLKGFFPAFIAAKMIESSFPLLGFKVSLAVAAALLAVVGHMYSPFLGCKGGKGVATAMGAFVALAPIVALLAFVVWVSVLLLFGFVSLASLIASWSFVPLGLAFSINGATLLGAALISVLITWRHRANVLRLCRGVEPKKVIGKGKHSKQKTQSNKDPVSIDQSVGEPR